MSVVEQHAAHIERPTHLHDLAVLPDGDTGGLFVGVVIGTTDGSDALVAWGDCERHCPLGSALLIRRESLLREDGLSLIGRWFASMEDSKATILPLFARAKGGAA